MPTDKQYEALIKEPSGNFHFVYNMLKVKWMSDRTSSGQRIRGFDSFIAKVLRIHNRTSISQRKTALCDYRLSADEYIALSECFNVPVQDLVYAHRGLPDNDPS